MILEPDTISVLEWAKDIGGWAVVVWICWQLMRQGEKDRQDHREEIRLMVETWTKAVDAFKAFEDEERKTHGELLASLRRIEKAVGR